MTRRIFIDCVPSRTSHGGGEQIFWVGLADEDGNVFSAVNADVGLEGLDDRIRDQVLPLVPADEVRLPRDLLASAIVEWVGPNPVQWWTWRPPVEESANTEAADEQSTPQQTTHSCALEGLVDLVNPWPEAWEDAARDVNDVAHHTPYGVDLPDIPRPYHPALAAAWVRDVWSLFHDATFPGGGIPLVVFYIPLAQPLPVPDGFTLQAKIRNPPLSRIRRLGAAAGIEVSLSCQQAIDTHSQPFADMSLLFRTAEEFVDDVPVLTNARERQMTVVEAFVPLDRGIASTPDFEPGQYSDEFDLALRAVRRLQEAYALLSQEPVLLTSLKTLPPALPVWVGRIEDYGLRPRRTWSGVFLVNDYAAVSTAPREPLDARGLDGLRLALAQSGEAQPFGSYAALRREAWTQRAILGNWRLAVLTAAVSGEMLLDTILLHLHWELGTPPEDVAQIFTLEGPRHTKRILTEYSGLLGGHWSASGNGVVARYLSEVVALRHRIVHRGYDPRLEEVDRSLAAMSDLERFLADRLTSDRCLNRFTRTAQAWCGNRGLQQRGRLTARVRRLLDSPVEPNWHETFGRWRRIVEVRAEGNRPAPGHKDNEQRVYLLVWRDGERRWLVHDVDALAAVILPSEEIAVPQDMQANVDRFLSRTVPADGGSPFRIHLEGVSYSRSELHIVWLDEYELLPELGILLPHQLVSVPERSRGAASIPFVQGDAHEP